MVMKPLSLPGEVEGEEDDEILPPTPDDIALTILQGLLASGKYEDIKAASVAAWNIGVPAFFEARNQFPEFMEKIHGRG